jgi:hypothetical protein
VHRSGGHQLVEVDELTRRRRMPSDQKIPVGVDQPACRKRRTRGAHSPSRGTRKYIARF